MFLKDHLKDIYQKASFDKNHLLEENIINRWAHRFGIETLNELKVKNQNQINLELLENVKNKEEIYPKPNEAKQSKNNEMNTNNTSLSNKSNYKVTEELPLPNINNLRKWINSDKKAS